MEKNRKDVEFYLKIVNEAIKKRANQDLKRYNLTLAQFHVLIILEHAEEKTMSQKQLERYFEVAHPTMVGLLNTLEEKELIVCRFDGKDKRIKNVYLTDKVSAIKKDLDGHKEKTQKVLLKGISEKERELLVNLLKKMFENLEEVDHDKNPCKANKTV